MKAAKARTVRAADEAIFGAIIVPNPGVPGTTTSVGGGVGGVDGVGGIVGNGGERQGGGLLGALIAGRGDRSDDGE